MDKEETLTETSFRRRIEAKAERLRWEGTNLAVRKSVLSTVRQALKELPPEERRKFLEYVKNFNVRDVNREIRKINKMNSWIRREGRRGVEGGIDTYVSTQDAHPEILQKALRKLYGKSWEDFAEGLEEGVLEASC